MTEPLMPKPRSEPPETQNPPENQALNQAAARFLDVWQRNLAAWAEGWPNLKPGGTPPGQEP
jgi:hypothetical protein